jgi:hypothetical protein
LPPAPGAMMMKPRVSAVLWNQECALPAFPPQ